MSTNKNYYFLTKGSIPYGVVHVIMTAEEAIQLESELKKPNYTFMASRVHRMSPGEQAKYPFTSDFGLESPDSVVRFICNEQDLTQFLDSKFPFLAERFKSLPQITKEANNRFSSNQKTQLIILNSEKDTVQTLIQNLGVGYCYTPFPRSELGAFDLSVTPFVMSALFKDWGDRCNVIGENDATITLLSENADTKRKSVVPNEVKSVSMALTPMQFAQVQSECHPSANINGIQSSEDVIAVTLSLSKPALERYQTIFGLSLQNGVYARKAPVAVNTVTTSSCLRYALFAIPFVLPPVALANTLWAANYLSPTFQQFIPSALSMILSAPATPYILAALSLLLIAGLLYNHIPSSENSVSMSM